MANTPIKNKVAQPEVPNRAADAPAYYVTDPKEALRIKNEEEARQTALNRPMQFNAATNRAETAPEEKKK